MTLIADDPTVRCMERTGYPPWMVYGGKNDEEEQETEHVSQAQADAIRNEFLRKNGLLDTGGTSSGAWYGGYASKEQTKLDANEKKSSSGKNRRT